MPETDLDAWLSLLLGEELLAELRTCSTLPAPPVPEETTETE